MRAGDRAAARRLLERLVERFGRDPLAAEARYELAHLLLQSGEPDRAERHLREIVAGGAGGMAEPAGWLLCRTLQQRGRTEQARACYQGFRVRHPRSPHDEAALGALLAVAGGCAEARPIAAELAARYPRGRLSVAARRWLQQCPFPSEGGKR